MVKTKALVIGAGIGGLAAAIRLAVQGFQVEVFEANSYAGGKLSEITDAGFRFDAGPSLLTMPQYMEDLFTLAGKNTADYISYFKLDVLAHYFYDDGTMIKAYADEAKLAEEMAGKTNVDVQDIHQYFKKSRQVYGITHHVFLEQSLHRLKTYLNQKTFKSIFRLPQIDAFRTMHAANQQLFRDKRVVQFFDRYATYNGSNPYQAPATLNVIPHLEQNFGAYFPIGGMYAITKALLKLAEELGVIFHFDTPVDEIILNEKSVTGLTAKNKHFSADLAVSNMDVYLTYSKLLRSHPELMPKQVKVQQRSSSALIFYWGINRTFEELDLHNIFFSNDYQAEFDHIWTHRDISDDPTVYVNISSKYQKEDAPAGCENWFTMINVPADQGQDWDNLVKLARVNILKKLSARLNADIASAIVSETMLDPRGIASKTASFQGAIYGTSSNNAFAAFLRQANRSSRIKNLYFCGGSVHPGGGIPLALLSAKITTDWIKDSESRQQ